MTAPSLQQSDEARELREALTRRAIGDVLRVQLHAKRLSQIGLCRLSGVSRTHLQDLLRGKKQASLFILLELCRALKFEDETELLRAILRRRKELRRRQEHVEASPGGPATPDDDIDGEGPSHP